MNDLGIDTETLAGGEVRMPKLEVVKLADGLGFGNPDGISHQRRLDGFAAPDDTPVSPDEVEMVENHIVSDQVLVPVDKDKQGKMLDDDGCGDGRGWKRILVMKGGEVREKTKSLNRAKQFGGGMTMAVAGLVATGQVAGKKMRDVLSDGIALLESKRLGFGAHTDDHDHTHGPNCGCGAIDRAPEIFQNSLTYEPQIRSVLTDVLSIDDQYIEIAYNNIRDFVPTMDASTYRGKDVAEEVIEEGKVVKELEGKHLEMYILLNEVYGFTVDQEKIRTMSDEKIQVFSVDVWRMWQQADQTNGQEAEKWVTFTGELIYTLATAATLTAGDLPVYKITEKQKAA